MDAIEEFKPKKKIGGYRPGAGRKKKTLEDNVKQAIKNAAGKDLKLLDRIWTKVFKEAENGSKEHIKILFDYYYGKPVETMMINSKQMIVKRIIIDEGAAPIT